MTETAESRARLARLRAEVRADRAAAAQWRDEVARYLEGAPWQSGDPTLAAVALGLHHFYSSVESLFERVLREFEGAPSSGGDTHRRVLEAVSLEIEGVRPAVISAGTREALREVLKFRHFLRHAYAVALDPDKLRAKATELPAVADALARDLDAFDAHLAAAAAALAP